MTQETKAKAKKIGGIIGNVLLWIFFAFACIVTIITIIGQSSKDGIPEVFGTSLMTIETPSMEPTYKVGDLVFLEKKSEAELREMLEPGMIITYHAPIDINGDGNVGDLNTHRVDEIDGLYIYTQGDNNEVRDDYFIFYGDIVGICTEDGKIGGIGNVIRFLRTPLGFFLCIVLPLVLLFLYEMYNFITVLVSERAKKAPVSAEAEEDIKRRAIEEYLRAQAEAEGGSADEPKDSSEDGGEG